MESEWLRIGMKFEVEENLRKIFVSSRGLTLRWNKGECYVLKTSHSSFRYTDQMNADPTANISRYSPATTTRTKTLAKHPTNKNFSYPTNKIQFAMKSKYQHEYLPHIEYKIRENIPTRIHIEFTFNASLIHRYIVAFGRFSSDYRTKDILPWTLSAEENSW